jgi:hypothetical protein
MAKLRHTAVSIDGDRFRINGELTYKGRYWEGTRIEGLLMNTRMVQGIFDDRNPETVGKWAYPDTGRWDPERNVDEFIAAMPSWKAHGVLAFTINLQGGSPEGYSETQPWLNSAFLPDGGLDEAYMSRLERILDRADELGMVAIVGLFYFGQDVELGDERAVKQGVANAVAWLAARKYRNILLEIANECDIRYYHPILLQHRHTELIELARLVAKALSYPLPIGTSFSGRYVPNDKVVEESDFLLVHGNSSNLRWLPRQIELLRNRASYRGQPIVNNEDDHFDFDQPDNHFVRTVRLGASWGYFDPGASNYFDGYQCPPVEWGINTERKRQFFLKVREITGIGGTE